MAGRERPWPEASRHRDRTAGRVLHALLRGPAGGGGGRSADQGNPLEATHRSAYPRCVRELPLT